MNSWPKPQCCPLMTIYLFIFFCFITVEVSSAFPYSPYVPRKALVFCLILVPLAEERHEVHPAVRRQRRRQIVYVPKRQIGAAQVHHEVPEAHPEQLLVALQLRSHDVI